MKRIRTISLRRLAAVSGCLGAVGALGGVGIGVLGAVGIGAVGALGPAPAGAAVSPGPVTRTFSYIAKPNSRTGTLVSIDALVINARCDPSGRPLVFAVTSSARADIFGRVFDGYGRVHIFKNTSFTSKTKGIQLSPTSGDFDATGSVLFETSTGKVVTVNIAFDNSTTLAGQSVCTVFGSAIAT